MSDDPKDPQSTPGQDVRKAFGLLYRAAKTAVDQLPTRKVEEAVTMGAKEVGRAIENVASTLEKEIFRGGSRPPAAGAEPPKEDEKDAHDAETPPKGDA
jgi:hypothetical protein